MKKLLLGLALLGSMTSFANTQYFECLKPTSNLYNYHKADEAISLINKCVNEYSHEITFNDCLAPTGEMYNHYKDDEAVKLTLFCLSQHKNDLSLNECLEPTDEMFNQSKDKDATKVVNLCNSLHVNSSSKCSIDASELNDKYSARVLSDSLNILTQKGYIVSTDPSLAANLRLNISSKYLKGTDKETWFFLPGCDSHKRQTYIKVTTNTYSLGKSSNEGLLSSVKGRSFRIATACSDTSSPESWKKDRDLSLLESLKALNACH